MRKAVATSALTLTIILLALLSSVGSVSALAFGSASLIYANTFFDVFGLSTVSIPYGHLYSGSNCAAVNLITSTPSVFHGFQVYVILFGGYPAGSYSMQVDGDINIGNPTGCVPFTILPLPTTTVTVTNTVTAATTVTVATTVTLFTSALAEYPYGLPILAILTIIAYGMVRRRNRN